MLRPLQMLLAYKAALMSQEGTASEKRVLGAIIDHYNRKSGRCDPSLGRIAQLLGVSRRTVMRAIHRLEGFQLLRKNRHGGNLNRNSYEPNWSRLSSIDQAWNTRLRARSLRSAAPELSLWQGQTCHVAGDQVGSQTLPKNQFYHPVPQQANSEQGANAGKLNRAGISKKEIDRANVNAFRRGLRKITTSSATAARTAAERRFSDDLLTYSKPNPDVYAGIIEAIDLGMQAKAVEAELKRRGGGLEYIFEQLRMRAATPSAVIHGSEVLSKQRGADD
jgi:AraC-like DNA-binding protein